MGRLKAARNFTTLLIIIGAILLLTTCENAIFGATVGISGGYMIAGAPWQTVNEFALAGTAGLYTRTGTADWNSAQIQELKPTNPNTEDWFGISTTIDGKFILVGAPYIDTFGTNNGTVYMYEINDSGTVSYRDTITPSDITSIQGFGFDIAVDGNSLIVGATDPISGGGPGAAYIFD
ncbi:MAG: hypothetical protein PF693_01375 [Spirochaetia bacterium]|nr:hypothetical protein [Spirochaetia bacterium]